MLVLWSRPQIPLGAGTPSRWVRRHKRVFLGGLAAVLLVAAIGFAWIKPPEPIPDTRGFFLSLDRSLLATLVLAGAAFIWFSVGTSYRATRELLRVARQTPEQMFPYAPEAGLAKDAFGRERLVRDIANGVLSPGAGPQIVLGGTGSGKTTVLLDLASHLAEEHQAIPIVLSLRDRDNDLEQHDFNELAMKRFRDLVDPYIKADADADRLWRSLLGKRRRRIVVLADDLDRSSQVNDQDSYRTQIRLALDAARRRDLPLVLTTRPSGLPPNLSEVPIDLSVVKLEGKERPAEYVLRRAGRKDKDEETLDLVERNIKRGHLLENAFYLSLLVGLLRVGALKEPAAGGRHAVRLGLLRADRERIRGKDLLSEEGRKHRDTALEGIEELAVASLVPAESEALPRSWQAAVRDGERLGLLSLDDRGRPQFKHEVLHAYYASRAIHAGAPWKWPLKQRPNGARVQLALVLTAARRDKEHFCRAASRDLLADEKWLNPDQRLGRAAGAAELVRAGAVTECDEEIVDALLDLRVDAGPVAKRTALGQLKRLGGERAVEALWEYAQDDSYGTRWEAVRCLVERCSARPGDGDGLAREGRDRGDGAVRWPYGADAYGVIEPKIDEALEEARPERELPDWDRKIVALKLVAWMLPSLRTAAQESCLRERIDARLQELLRLQREGVTCERGLEASIAQGFKDDARRNPCKPPDRDAKEMLRTDAVFWYSQLNLVHALALRMAMDSASSRHSLAAIVAAVKLREHERRRGWNKGNALTGDLHPMLRYAAKLCERALKGEAGEDRLSRIKRVVWKDEGVVVSRRPRKLDPAAAQLVGDVTVLLNLNETGNSDQRRAFGEDPTLPHCLQKSRRRRELREGCHDDCEFKLCPFQPAHGRLSAHRELSRAFCRDQQQRASRRTARGWDARMIRRALPEFWRWLEAQARF